jgi:hypothetical protein
VNTLVNDYVEAVRAAYGDDVANNLDMQVKDGWYLVMFKENPGPGTELWATQPTRYRKTQLQTTIANLKARAKQ